MVCKGLKVCVMLARRVSYLSQSRLVSGANQEQKHFSISEFARLCVIVRDDEDAKAALHATGQDLSRMQIDAEFTRESFWGLIEARFNDPTLRLCLNMIGNVDEVDSTKPPLCLRSATFLKEKFSDARRSFTVCVENWYRSGQNDTTNFKTFAGTRNGALTASRKRNIVMFVCARMGNAHEDSSFRNICLRTIPHGGGVDEGGTVNDIEGGASPLGIEAPSRRNRRRSSGNENESANNSLVQLSEFFIERGRKRDEERKLDAGERRVERQKRRAYRREQHQAMRERAANRRESRKRKRWVDGNLQQLKENQELLKLLRYTTETLKSQGQDPGTELIVVVRQQQQALFRAIKMPENGLEGLRCDISLSDREAQVPGEGVSRARSANFSSEQQTGRERDGDDEIMPNM